jgi:hypothetical protein
MERYCNGIWLEGEVVPDKWVVRTWEKNGVLERSATSYIAWREVGQPCGFQLDGWTPIRDLDPVEDADLIAERRERALNKAAKRAKTTCRRVIVTEAFDELLTLTYRGNQADWELCKQHVAKWVRRMKKALGGQFRYCLAFERQERGAMHVHIATHKLPTWATDKGVKVKAWQVGTRIWRDIVGDNNGLCFVGGKGKFGGPAKRRWTLAKMAAYVSKYITKSYDDAPPEANRYQRSTGADVGRPESWVVDCTFGDLIGLCYEYKSGDSVLALRAGRWNDRLWFCKERPPDAPA